MKKLLDRVHSKFENRSRGTKPPMPLIIRFTWRNYSTPAILRETSEGTSY